MNLFARLRGKLSFSPNDAPPDRNSRPRRRPNASSRRELINVALRDTLAKHSIPTAWVGAETLVLRPATGDPSLHVKLLIRHFDMRLLTQSLAFEKSFLQRLAAFDTQAQRWLGGVSWQYALVKEPEADPTPRPAPGRRSVAPSAREAAKQGPTEEEKLAELRRLFALGDVERSIANAVPSGGADFADTQPFESGDFSRR